MSLAGGGMDKYPAKAHARRTATAMGVDTGLVVLGAAKAENWPNSDMPRPFRQDRYFYYLTGCKEPDCYASYDVAHDKLTLWLPPINKARVVWTGRGSTVEEALQKYDIDAAQYIHYKEVRHYGLKTVIPSIEDSVTQWVQTQDQAGGRLYCVGGAFGQEDEQMYQREMALKRAMDACRVIKDEHEIRSIKQANEISSKAHTAVLRNLSKFTGEAEVEAQYMQVCIASRAKEQAYDPIAGAGTNASELHYVKNDEPFSHRTQLLVLDAGCEVGCYASDVTRTMPVNRRHPGYWPSEEAENTYKLVEKVQEACIKQMKPGNTFVDIHRLAQSMIVDGLMDLGILKGKREEIAEAGIVLGFFPHGLGHHMGLEVHDVSPSGPRPSVAGVGTLAFEPSLCRAPCVESAPTMEPGMVITVEPGVYFNRFLLETFFLCDPERSKFIGREVLRRYMGVGGVRIEDDILITRDGHENLTMAPKGQAMLDIIREGAKESRSA